MTTISVRLTEDEKKNLKKHGEISKVVRDAITTYLASSKSKETIKRLEELQKTDRAKTTSQQETLLKDIKNGKAYLNIFSELIQNKTIQLIRPDNNIIQNAYTQATKKKTTFYDTIFIALSQDLKLELKTYDKKQLEQSQ